MVLVRICSTGFELLSRKLEEKDEIKVLILMQGVLQLLGLSYSTELGCVISSHV